MRGHLLVQALLLLAVALCVPPVVRGAPQKPKPLLSVDNYGGFSHGGRRVLAFADGSCEELIYTDDLGDQKRRQRKCSLDPKAGILTLDSDEADPERLFRVDSNGKQYWVNRDEVDRIKQPGEKWLRQTSLRNRR